MRKGNELITSSCWSIAVRTPQGRDCGPRWFSTSYQKPLQSNYINLLSILKIKKLKRRNLLVCTVPDRNEREKACSVARREWEAKRRGESWCYHFLAPSPPQRERDVWASRTPDPTLVFILVQSNYESNTQFTSTWCQITT